MSNKSLITNKEYFIKYFIIVFFVLSFLYTILISFIEFNTLNVKRSQLEKNEERIIGLEKRRLGKEFNNIISDILFLSDSFHNHSLKQTTLDDTEREWIIFADRKKIYDQIRFINVNGDERIRINYKPSGAYVVDEKELQNKKDRYYFKDSINLEKEQIYISKLDLNIENSVIELPIKPMIRFSTPVKDKNGSVKGIIVLNYNAQNLLNEFKDISQTSLGEVFLLNSNGYWVYNKDSNKEWAFMYQNKENISFSNQYPLEWKRMVEDGQGNIYTGNGFFVFSNIVTRDSINIYQGKLKNNNVVLGEGDWTAVSFISKDNEYWNILEQNNIRRILNLLVTNKFVFLLICVVSIGFSILLVFNKNTKDKIKYFSEYDAMTNVFNRRAGLSMLNESYQKMMKAKDVISICFIDINGLKEVNDELGHEAGDELILSIVNGIKNNIRQSDYIIRLGGDEFLLVFPSTASHEAEEIWKRILTTYQKINDEEDRAYLLSASHGIEECTNEGLNYIDNILNAADEKMYKEKRQIKKDIMIIRKPRA